MWKAELSFSLGEVDARISLPDLASAIKRESMLDRVNMGWNKKRLREIL